MSKNKQNKKIMKSPGSSPGTLVYTGSREQEGFVEIYSVGKDKYEHSKISNLNEIKKVNKNQVNWINIVGLKDVEKIKQIGEIFNIDVLILEDILNINQRPKIEFNDEMIFISLKGFIKTNDNKVTSQQISFILKENTLITFKEQEMDIFKPILSRINNPNSKIRTRKADYFLYALIDIVVDYYMAIIENNTEVIENIDQELSQENYSNQIGFEIYKLRQELSNLKKKMSPVRELINTFQKIESKLIYKDSQKYFKDLYEHTVIVNENLDNQKESLSEILSLYHTHINNSLNQTMKVLTIISTIFIPLSFIVGLYGMNFVNIPELNWQYGYYMVWGLIAVISTSMIIYFKKKSWL